MVTPATNLAWVTGARGFLGRHVARALSEAGWRVVGIGHGEWSPDESRVWGIDAWRSAEIDLPALVDLSRVAGRPKVVFHAAGSGSVGFSLDQPLEDFQRTVATTAAVCEAVRTLAPDALVIYPSSAAVYGVAGKGPIGEQTTLAPVSPYGVHKLLAELLCLSGHRSFRLRCAIVRFFSLYGSGLRKQLVWDLVRRITAEPREVRLHGTGDETRDFLHVEDAARLVALVAAKAPDEPLVVNGGSGEAVSVRTVAEMVASMFGDGVTLRFTGESRAGDPQHYQADPARLRRLGFAPQWTLSEGLREYVRWLVKSEPASR